MKVFAVLHGSHIFIERCSYFEETDFVSMYKHPLDLLGVKCFGEDLMEISILFFMPTKLQYVMINIHNTGNELVQYYHTEMST